MKRKNASVDSRSATCALRKSQYLRFVTEYKKKVHDSALKDRGKKNHRKKMVMISRVPSTATPSKDRMDFLG
jgi:hypothetical protein